MLNYQTWSDVVTGALIGAAVVLVLLSQNQISGQERKFTLPARIIGGLGLCCLGASIVSPPLFSPRLTLEGPVTGFHQATSYRSSSHFEFSVNPNGRCSGVLRAHYFDKGFYFGDPMVSDGDVVRVSYFTWTNDVLEIRETIGRHAGWAYREDENGVGPWVLCALGAYLFFGGIISWISDMPAQPDTAG